MSPASLRDCSGGVTTTSDVRESGDYCSFVVLMRGMTEVITDTTDTTDRNDRPVAIGGK